MPGLAAPTPGGPPSATRLLAGTAGFTLLQAFLRRARQFELISREPD